MEHHKIFSKYTPWKGICPADRYVDFLGIMTRQWHRLEGTPLVKLEERYVQTSLPSFNEDYFETIDVLEAVESAGDTFNMIELGAGFGHWSVKSIKVAALNNKKSKVTAIEAEPAHYQSLITHFRDNNIHPEEHDLLQFAVSATDEPVHFITGHPDTWFGQSIVPEGFKNRQQNYPDAKIVQVNAISLNKLIKENTIVDLIDMDIQGAEYEVLEPAINLLNKTVKRIHIGTHGKQIEEDLRNLFTAHNWIKKYDFGCAQKIDTEFGEIEFGDGIQTWVNPKL